jgi:outer membrane lipoprotein SlyB
MREEQVDTPLRHCRQGPPAAGALATASKMNGGFMASSYQFRPQWAAALLLASTLGMAHAQGTKCAVCGTVDSVSRVQDTGSTSGVGAVAGGVLGGVVGNQVGNGRGRTLATVAGAAGGAMAGNSVERNRNTHTVYRVNVRMQDGSTRTIDSASSFAVGQPVTVKGNSIFRN